MDEFGRIHDWMTVAEACERLGLSRQRIHKLIEANQLEGVKLSERTTLVSRGSVARLKRSKRPKGRPFSQKVAFAVLCELSGIPSKEISPTQKCRIAKFLDSADAAEVAAKCRMRARVERGYLPESMLKYLVGRCRLSGVSAIDEYRLGVTKKQNEVELYTDEVGYECLAQIGFASSCNGTFVVHVSDFVAEMPGEMMPEAFCALDLVDSQEPRLKTAGLEKIGDLLEEKRNQSR